MTDDVKRLLDIIFSAPNPYRKTDSELAQEYRNWFYGIRTEKIKASEAKQPPRKAEI